MDNYPEIHIMHPELFSWIQEEPSHSLPPPCPQESPNNYPQKMFRNMKRKIESKKTSNYYWSDAENKRYILAVQKYSHILNLSPQDRRLKKVNVLLSKHIRTRTPLQCHSHHQKMIKKYGSVEAIIALIHRPPPQKGSRNNTQGIKPRGRPPKNPIPLIQQSTPQVKVAADPERSPWMDAHLFNVLQVGQFDLQEQEVERFSDLLQRATMQDQLIQMNFRL